MSHFAFVVSMIAAAAEWTPPEKPDPQAILQEAHQDAMAKRYETALAKHVWFHEHALEFQPAQYGVRLSFALMYWHELAEKYPPALEALEAARDEAEKKVKAGDKVRESFHDLVALNRTLEEDRLTTAVFAELAESDPKGAKTVFELAQPALVRTKAYELYSRHVDPVKDLDKLKQRFEQDRKLAANPRFGDRHLDFAKNKFTNAATTLVAILAITHRQDEADKIARLAKEAWDDSEFRKEIEKAREGAVPDPWP